MKAYLIMAAVCGAAFTLPAQAQTWREIEARYTPQYVACMDSGAAAQGQDAAMARCMTDEVARQDAMLGNAYTVRLASLGDQQQKALSADEKAWAKTRESVCTEEVLGVVAGSKRNLAFAECMLDATVRRAIMLDSYRP